MYICIIVIKYLIESIVIIDYCMYICIIVNREYCYNRLLYVYMYNSY